MKWVIRLGADGGGCNGFGLVVFGVDSRGWYGQNVMLVMGLLIWVVTGFVSTDRISRVICLSERSVVDLRVRSNRRYVYRYVSCPSHLAP